MGPEETTDSQRVTVMPDDTGDPESGEDRGIEICFDKSNPESVREAERLIQKRFGLSEAPPLCSEPSPGILRRIVRSLTPRRPMPVP